MLSISCITDTDWAQNPASSLGAAQSAVTVDTDRWDAAFNTHSNPIPILQRQTSWNIMGSHLILISTVIFVR